MSNERINTSEDRTSATTAAGGAPTLSQAVMPRPRFDVTKGIIEIPTPLEGGFLEFDPGQRVLNAQQMAILSPLKIEANWDVAYVVAFLNECYARGLDPWSGEAFLMKYPTGYVRHIGIAGFLRIAEETPGYEGMDQVVYFDEDDRPFKRWPHRDRAPYAAEATAYRRGRRPQTVAVLYDEYVPMVEDKTRVETSPGKWERVKTGNGKVPSPMWRTGAEGGKATVMLGKCARSAALRLQFPRKFAGFYEPAELERDAEGVRNLAPDERAEERRAAYAAAQAAQDPRTVDGAEVGATVRETITVHHPDGPGVEEHEVRALLLAELDAQAALLGKDREWMTRRWSEARGGQAFETATVVTMTGHVHRFREYVIGKLRETGRDHLAVKYAAAPVVGTLEELFGTAEPWKDPDDQAPNAAAEPADDDWDPEHRCAECGEHQDVAGQLNYDRLCRDCVATAAEARETVGASA